MGRGVKGEGKEDRGGGEGERERKRERVPMTILGFNFSLSAGQLNALSKQALIFAREYANPNATLDPVFTIARHKVWKSYLILSHLIFF